MREACLEVEAVAACMAARPGQPQRCQLAGACSTRWIRCPAPRRALCSRSRSSAEPRRPPRRAGVPLHICRPGSVRGTLHTPSGCPRIQDMLTRKRMPACPARQVMSTTCSGVTKGRAPRTACFGGRAGRHPVADDLKVTLRLPGKSPPSTRGSTAPQSLAATLRRGPRCSGPMVVAHRSPPAHPRHRTMSPRCTRRHRDCRGLGLASREGPARLGSIR